MRLAPAIAVLALLGLSGIYANGEVYEGSDKTGSSDLDPPDPRIGPLGNTGAHEKFDPGLHEKILGIMESTPNPGDPGVYDGIRYYNVILVVSRDYQKGSSPDLAAAENKASLAEHLEFLGARDIGVAEELSFVTASVPVSGIPGASLLDEV
ncbi:MAG: hypothetical protein MPI93_09030, partial [Nitrosopumilus sp.]|nr:hypothetical protein [Nitrosopumilus sp.]